MSGHAVIDIRNTYGCAFIGLIISVMLFGITTLQTWIYYWQYGNRDQKALKLFIAVIFLLDALHTSLCIYSVYWYLVLNFGNVEVLDTGVWTMGIQVLINTLISYMVQLYYARRVYIVGGSIVIPTIIVILGTACLALALVFTIGVTPTTIGLGSRYASLIPVTCIGLGSAVVADILIAVSMCWFLYHKRTGFARRVPFSPFTPQIWLSFREQNRFRNHDLDDLQCQLGFTDKRSHLRSAYQRKGSLVYFIIFLCYDQFIVSPSTMYTEIFYWPMSKFYANSLLAMLNSRDYVRERSSTNNKHDNAFDLSSIRIEQRSEGDKSTRRPAVSVTVHRSATTDFPQGKRDHDVGSGFRAQCSSSLAFSNVPHWRAALATPARHNPDPNGHLCEVSHHADACTTTSDHLRPTNPISIPDLAALARGSSPSIPMCPQLSRTHIRQLVPREGLRDTDDWVSSPFALSLDEAEVECDNAGEGPSLNVWNDHDRPAEKLRASPGQGMPKSMAELAAEAEATATVQRQGRSDSSVEVEVTEEDVSATAAPRRRRPPPRARPKSEDEDEGEWVGDAQPDDGAPGSRTRLAMISGRGMRSARARGPGAEDEQAPAREDALPSWDQFIPDLELPPL
ncbi:hypothetical protein EDB86DRAFT_3077553 [Lactarius hatsudake]|nr:hypothetical protein EDB86DRAFT_3077553 [Lactarius hatsudake]